MASKVAIAKRDTWFAQIQDLYDLTLKLDKTNVNTFRAKGANLEMIKDEFCAALDEVIKQELAADDNYAPDYKPLSAFMELYGFVKLKLDLVQTKPSPASSVDEPKLKKLELPTFNGEYNQWQIFKDTFEELVYNKTNFTPQQKMQYLAPCLKGKALKTISGLACTGSNFETIWKALMDKYDDKRLVANALI